MLIPAVAEIAEGVSSLGQYRGVWTNITTLVLTLLGIGAIGFYFWYIHRERPSGGHSSVRQYCLVALILAVITAIEVSIPYASHHIELRQTLYLTAMYFLAILKFVIVVMFFMHLFFDRWVCTFLFGIGMLLILGSIFALLGMFPGGPVREQEPYVPPAEHHAALPQEAAPAGPPSAHRGRQVFVREGCGHCHKVAGEFEAVGTAGPPLDGVTARAASRIEGRSAEEYLRESILEPRAYVVRGFLNVMPDEWDRRLSPQELEDLVAYLKSLGLGALPAAA